MTLPSSRSILDVERAVSDVRRGVSVVLEGYADKPLLVSAGEYAPGAPATAEETHPAVQLMKIAGLLPNAVVEPAADTDISHLLRVTAQAIIDYPPALAASLDRVSEALVPLKGAGEARVIAFRPRFGHEEHLAVVIGNITDAPAPYVRVHSSCITGDVFGSLRCDCGEQLQLSLALIVAQGAGVVLYLSQEGRGIGIANKLRAYNLQSEGLDTVEANASLGFAADERDFALAASMLKQLGILTVTLLTNNPQKVAALEEHGITVAGRVPVVTAPNPHNQSYLDAKAGKLGHQL